MNEKLFKQKLSSIRHYNDEIEKLSNALEVTRSTRSDIIKSLVEFCPVKPGDVVLVSDFTTIKIKAVRNALIYDNGELGFYLTYLGRAQYQAFGDKEGAFKLETISTWKVVATDESIIPKTAPGTDTGHI